MAKYRFTITDNVTQKVATQEFEGDVTFRLDYPTVFSRSKNMGLTLETKLTDTTQKEEDLTITKIANFLTENMQSVRINLLCEVYSTATNEYFTAINCEVKNFNYIGAINDLEEQEELQSFYLYRINIKGEKV